MTTGDHATTLFTAVSCSDWFGLKPLQVLYVLLTNTNTFKPQFDLTAFNASYTNTLSLQSPTILACFQHHAQRAERPSSAAADVTTGETPTTSFTAVSCSGRLIFPNLPG
jgi:hypothetical protein